MALKIRFDHNLERFVPLSIKQSPGFPQQSRAGCEFMVSLLAIPKSLWIWKGANELQGSNVLMTATCYLLSIHDKNNDDSNFTCLNIQLRESPNVCQQFMTRTETTEIFNSAGSVPASLRFAFGRRTCDLRGSMYPKGTTETATWRGANMTPL